jgi:hypothetical protein
MVYDAAYEPCEENVTRFFLSLSLPFLLLLVLPACDDTLFGATGKVYEPNWEGVQEMFGDQCTVACHNEGWGYDMVLPSGVEEDVSSDMGAFVVAGSAEDSPLWWALNGSNDMDLMPPTGSLPIESIEHVKEWIDDGAGLVAEEEETGGEQ